MKFHRSDRRIQLAIAFVLIALSTATTFGQETAARPDRGVMPNGSYAVSDIENISLSNGNVNLKIPLASLPPIAGGKLSWTINAHYNSKLWNMNRVQLMGERFDLSEVPYVVDTPELSEQGGWRISGQYQIEIRDVRSDFDYQLPPVSDEPDYSLMNNYNWYRAVLIMPDGAEHELRPMDYSAYNGGKSFLYGYFKQHPYTHGTMRYYSFDGSYLYASITSDNNWTVYLPDGTKVIQTTDGIQRIQDTNGNKIKIWTDTATHYQDEQTGREIRFSYNASGQGVVSYQTVTGTWQEILINFGTTSVTGQLYRVNDWVPGQVPEQPCWHHQELNTLVAVIRDITLPQTESGVTRKFSFGYSSDSTETASNTLVRFNCTGPTQTYVRTASKGWGFLNHIETPSGAQIDYTLDLDATHFPIATNDLPKVSITQKKLIHDGITDTWTYSIQEQTSTVTNPDGSTITEDKYSQLPYLGSSFGKGGLAYRTTRPFSKTERHWTHLVFDGASVFSPNGNVDFNSVVDYEYSTLTDAAGNNLKMSAKAFQYDFNGNVTQTTEYDWFDPALVTRDSQGVPTGVPGSATVLRTTTNSYYNPATSSTSGNVYAKRSAATGFPLVLNALQQTTTGPAIAQFSYDGNSYGSAPTVGNLTSKSVWDDLGNKWITASSTYGLHGNVATTTDARGKVTQFFYDDATHALPNRVVVDPQNGTGTQTTTTAYDYSTGLVTSVTDPNNATSTIDYTNQLLGTIDPFGRPGVTMGPDLGGGVNHRTRTIYEDSARTVTVLSDLNSEGDGLLKSQVISDMLGRTIESRQYETGSTFIAVRKTYDAQNRLSKTSNPFRAGESVVWTTTAADTAGRVISVTTPDNAVVVTSYDANTVTVTDQAGKQRKSVSNALGQLTSVFEDPNGLNYQTSYDYDVLGNLRHVYQGTQTRTFTYDSLSRLRSAQNPESGTITYTYDDNGNLLTKGDARSIASNYVYDSLNRVTSRTYSDSTPAVAYVYDTLTQNGKGRLTSVSSSVSSYSYSGYDAAGKVLGGSQTISAQNYSMSYGYNLAGHVTSMTYPSGRTVTNTYDNAGRLSSFAGNLGDGTTRNYSTGILYSPFGGRAKEQFGTDTALFNKSFYNSRGQLAEIRVGTTYTGPTDSGWQRGAIINHYSDTCWGACGGQPMTDNNGNVKKQEHWIQDSNGNVTAIHTQQFDYDALNRLQRVGDNLSSPSWQQKYVYDRWGNRSIAQGSNETFGAGIPKPDFGVDPANNRLTAPGGYTMSYDQAGNLTNDTYTGQGLRTYDAENRMKQAWSNNQWQSYAYDGDGRRIKRVANGVETWQVYGLGGELLAEYAANASPSSPQKECGYRNGELLVTGEPPTGQAPPPTPQNVTWTNASATVQVTGNSIQKISGTAWWYDAGAASTQSITSGDGYMEFTAGEDATYRMAGLGRNDTGVYFDDIDYAFFLIGGGTLQIYESGVLRGTFGTYAASDRLKVSIESGVVKYYRNGNLVYTSTVAPQYPLQVDTSLNTVNAAIYDTVIANNVQNVTWTNVSATVQVTGNSIQKISGTASWYDAGAASTQSITSGDGYMEFTAGENATYRMAGLGRNDTGVYFDDIDYAFFLIGGGTLQIYESGVLRGTFGTYAASDRLKVSVESGVVKYYHNGNLVYTSTVAPQYPLQVDTSLNTVNAGIYNTVITSSAPLSTGSIRWLVTDQLGTPRMIFDQTGSLANVSRHDYLPFGEELYAGSGGRTTAQGYTASDNVRQKFTQKERDNETGLDYFGARYYASPQGRFTSTDPLLSSATIYDPQSWNRYAYVLNNPLRYIDPLGLYEWDASMGGSATDEELKKRKGGQKIIDKRNEFRSALAKAAEHSMSKSLSERQRAELQRSVNAYGKEGDANGVAIAHGKVTKGADAETTSVGAYGFTADPVTGAVTPNIKVTFKQGGAIDAEDIAHEGSHVADRAELVSALTPLMGVEQWIQSPLNLTKYATEFRAYQVTSAIAQGRGDPTHNAGGYEIWNRGWKEADRETKRANGINKLLRESSLYKVTPQNQGTRLVELKKK